MNSYFPKGVVLIERNGVGLGVIDTVRSLLPSNRIWKDDKDIPGVNSTKELRDLLYNDLLRRAAMDYYDKIYDKNIIDEIFTLEYTKQGRIDHPVGAHDDTLIAYLWCLYFLIHYKQKSKYIDPIYIGLHLNNTPESSLDKEELEEKIKMDQEKLYKKMNRWQNGNKFESNLSNDLLNGDMTPEEMVMAQNNKVREIDKNSFDLKNQKFNRYQFIDYLADEREKTYQEEVGSKVDAKKFDDKEKIEELEKVREKDTDEIEEKISLEEKLDLQRKFYETLRFNKGNNNSYLLNPRNPFGFR